MSTGVAYTSCVEVVGLFEYMRRRQAATDARRSGAPPPWSDDPIIASNFFCSVIRDDDRTSMEARAYIEGLPPEEQLRAALVFRLVNRVSTLRSLVESGARSQPAIRSALDAVAAQGPVFNPAYRIMVPGGWWNHGGVAQYMARLYEKAPYIRPCSGLARHTVEAICSVGPGPFLAYQIMQDLRWVWGPFVDEDTWAYIGPGAVRGLQRLDGTYKAMSSADRRRLAKGMKGTAMPEAWHRTMLQLLAGAKAEIGPHINMFEVEHNLCEWEKACRYATGETRGVAFHPTEAT